VPSNARHIILGYHGCDASTAEEVFSGKARLKPSQNDYDWLGDGIYFWEFNAQRAFDFAKAMAKRPHPSKQTIKTPAVVGAVIDPGFCLDLLDTQYIQMVKQAHQDLKLAMKTAGQALPENSGGRDLVARHLDCAVIRFLHKQREGDAEPFDTVRAAFMEGEPLYANAGFAAKSHIQVCVRNHRQIKGCFRPLDEKGKPVRF